MPQTARKIVVFFVRDIIAVKFNVAESNMQSLRVNVSQFVAIRTILLRPSYLNASILFILSFLLVFLCACTRARAYGRARALLRSILGIWRGIEPLTQVEYYNLKAYLCCCRCTCVKPEAEDSENGRI